MNLLLALTLAVGLAPQGRAAAQAPRRTVQIPYQLTSTNHVLIRAKLDGRGPFNFIIDTGAPALFVNADLCKKLGIKPDREGWGRFQTFELEGGLRLQNVKARVETPFQIEGMNSMGLIDKEIHGIIGYTIIARHRVEFDFTKHKMAWTPSNHRPPAPQGLGPQAKSGDIETMASLVKVLGALLGKKSERTLVFRGFLGFLMEEKDNAVVVKSVLSDSPAARAGLKAGDQVLTFQKANVRSIEEVYRAAGKLGPDQAIELKLGRGNETVVVNIKSGRGM